MHPFKQLQIYEETLLIQFCDEQILVTNNEENGSSHKEDSEMYAN